MCPNEAASPSEQSFSAACGTRCERCGLLSSQEAERGRGLLDAQEACHCGPAPPPTARRERSEATESAGRVDPTHHSKNSFLENAIFSEMAHTRGRGPGEPVPQSTDEQAGALSLQRLGPSGTGRGGPFCSALAPPGRGGAAPSAAPWPLQDGEGQPLEAPLGSKHLCHGAVSPNMGKGALTQNWPRDSGFKASVL